MSNKELQESFLWCVFHNDAQAWIALPAAYLEAGYPMNAAYCIAQAEEVAGRA